MHCITRRLVFAIAASLAASLGLAPLEAQVTTASMRGVITGENNAPLEAARVEALHVPSGTRYGTTSRADGSFFLPGMRVGGPYEVAVMRIGYERATRDGILISLGAATDVNFSMSQVTTRIAGVTVTGESGLISSARTGAATAVATEQIEQLPTISRRLGDFIRLTPQASGNSFAGTDPRLNNITVDGSYFNNSFGLGPVPGARTNVAPISLDAIEQVQVNIAPFDVRQSNFTGAAVNAVTKSGTNEVKGSLYYLTRNQDLVGTQAGANPFDPGVNQFSNIGVTLGFPILKDKLFFFGSFEDDGNTRPATNFTANTGGETVGGTKTRVLQSDLDQLSSFLQQNFNYTTGGYQGYDAETPSRRILGKVDYNLNENNKFSVRYSELQSSADEIASNSNSLGFGGRRTNTNALNFQNTNYSILENRSSLVGEWNSTFGGNKGNQLIIGYDKSDESRDVPGELFPLVDILEGGATYTSFGREPFSPANELRYNSFQLQNNFTIYGNKHETTFGLSFERYRSENSFFPGSQSAYVYNSLADFYTDANDFLANPNRTTSPVQLNLFQVRWSNIPGLDKPIQPLEVNYTGVYAQDQWRVRNNLTLTYGLRIEVPVFGETGFTNAQADGLTFRDGDGNPVQYQSGKLPDANPLFSPRFGFNWDVNSDRRTQVRGGTGVFTGRPAYVWISNQIGNTGVLTGFEERTSTNARPFHPDPDRYKPQTVTGDPASQYELALTEKSFRFPQIWRTNLAIDQQLPFGLVGTAEFLYSRDVNGINYINANLPEPTSFTGADTRPRWTPSNRLNSNVIRNVVLQNQAVGYSYNAAASLERAFANGFFAKAAYSYGMARNTVDPGSIASGSFNGNPHAGDPNNPGLGISANAAGHRFFGAMTYKKQYFGFGATGVSLFLEGRNAGLGSYRYTGDLNNDGGNANDLLYIPRNVEEMNFEQYTLPANQGGTTFTVAQQEAAWEAYIQQDEYLRGRRGLYAERNGFFLPMVYSTDVSVTQDVFTNIAGRRNTLQVRLDILNFGNMLNSDWGTGVRLVQEQPLVARGADGSGAARHRFRNVGQNLLPAQTFERTAGLNDVWRMQLGVRYIFN